jgi:signal transduction histidine kinase/CheY-like chemotaxis protein
MELQSDKPKEQHIFGLSRRQWKAALFLGVLYFFLMWLSEEFVPHPATLFPASAVAISILFLEGIELWPIVFLSSLIGSVLFKFPGIFLFIQPFSQTLQAIAGAYLLKKAGVDPIFRKYRDILYLIVILFLVSFIVPLLTSFGAWLSRIIFHTPLLIVSFNVRFVGTFLCLLIITPFMLRWFAKPRFSRTLPEMLEIIAVFFLLLITDGLLFINDQQTLYGFPLVYILFMPLFWIALRLRPRFVTLALLITAIAAFIGLDYGMGIESPGLFTQQLFSVEELLLALSIIFLTVVSLEENRRLNANLLHQQVATLENAVARISSESRAKNDFIAILAHELRNPLAPIMSSIDFLKLSPDRDPAELETLTMMDGMMQTVRRLLDDLLDISRISEGKIEIKSEPIDLETTINKAVISTAHHRQERHQSLTVTMPDNRLSVLGDPVRLEQVFSNLLTNASKYSDPGDKICITLERKGEIAQITVEDTGIGIKAESLERIFTPFHQVELGERSTKGLGIGLALVKSFIEMHEGTVSVASEGVGKGSTFIVQLPLVHANSARKSSPSTAVANTKKSQKKKPQSIMVLVVDDNDAAAWSMGKLLEMRGCAVEYAYDGRQAIEKTEQMQPQVILLDLGLPDQDGYRVAKTIRARGYRGKIIALTGYSGEEVRVKGSEVGFEHYLVKPAGLEDLKRVIPEIT